jgi:hypothetical protein
MIVRTIKHGLAVARNALETYNAKLSSSMCDFTVVTKRSGFRAQAMEYGECVRIDRQSTICEPRRLRPVFWSKRKRGRISSTRSIDVRSVGHTSGFIV